MANAQVKTSETTPTLRSMLREELQSSREEVLAQIKAEIAPSFKEIKKDIVSLFEETKADTRTSRRATETANKCDEMGAVLGETMDRVTALEQSQNLRLIGIKEGAEGGFSPRCSKSTTSVPLW